MATTSHWRGEPFRKKVNAFGDANVLKAAVFMQGDIKAAFPGSGVVGTLSGGGDPKNPSRPGEIPHVQSGHLKTSIVYEIINQGKTARVGSLLQPLAGSDHSYAFILEMYPLPHGNRPYFRPALKRNQKQLRNILTRGHR